MASAPPPLDIERVGYGVHTVVDHSGERFGANVTIAHLARYSFNNSDGDGLSAYAAVAILRHDWWNELESIIAQNGKAINVLFRDGSELRVLTPCQYGKPVDPHWRAKART